MRHKVICVVIWVISSSNTSTAWRDADEMGQLPFSLETKSQKASSDDGGVKVSLLIPCRFTDAASLDEVWGSIKEQTRMPDELIVSVAEGPAPIPDGDGCEYDKGDLEAEIKHDLHHLEGEYRLIDSVSVEKRAGLEGFLSRISKLEGSIPKIKVFLKDGPATAGQQRKFLLEQAAYTYGSFFDCDDYMHKRRMEAITTVLTNHRELDAVLHSYDGFSVKEAWPERWTDEGKEKFVSSIPFTDEELQSWTPSDRADELSDEPPFTDPEKMPFKDTAECVVTEIDFFTPQGEACYNHSWWMPKGIDKDILASQGTSPHNGWVTVRIRTAKEVGYPECLRAGQDSFFNWRLIKAGKKVVALPWKLGAYLMRQKEPNFLSKIGYVLVNLYHSVF
eukprot:GHVN01072816.1.p2 GENE.GHVN01072816.1~~GHVN01072816.1.p2  ORF type:complete len:391 (-),score=53.66 GHVN01072816.1:1388-2560(-)